MFFNADKNDASVTQIGPLMDKWENIYLWIDLTKSIVVSPGGLNHSSS